MLLTCQKDLGITIKRKIRMDSSVCCMTGDLLINWGNGDCIFKSFKHFLESQFSAWGPDLAVQFWNYIFYNSG